MKIGILGAGAVGSACLTALVARGCAREIVVVNRERKRAEGLVTDVQYGAVLYPYAELRAGDYRDLEGAALVMITAGANEKTGGATDRNDPAGRLRLLDTNAAVYQSIVPQHVAPPSNQRATQSKKACVAKKEADLVQEREKSESDLLHE